MPFEKGKSGNPQGVPANGLPPRPFEAALKRAVIQGNGKQLRDMAEKVLELAVEGEQWACVFVADRLDGKPRQAIPAADDNGMPVTVGSITYHIVDATKPTDRSTAPPVAATAEVKPIRPTMAAVRRSA